jgi:hypothetical protein
MALPLVGAPAGAQPSVASFEAEAGDVAGAARTLEAPDASAGGYVEFGSSDPLSSAVTVDGNRLLRNGRPWVPRGFTMIGALSPTASGNQADIAHQHLDANEMEAAKAWGADVLRFQVSQRGLDYTDSLFSAAYVDQVRQAVALARSYGFAVILSVQDQSLGGGNRHPQPSDATLRDWGQLTSMFNDDHEVLYEIFNEPQNQDDAASWSVWRDGGPPEGNLGTPAVGHQNVLASIRATGSTNVVIADGGRYANTLLNVPLLDDPLEQLAYGLHPYLSSTSRYPESWEGNFGYLTQTAPVIATEWNINSSSGVCHPEWPTTGPQLVNFLDDHNIGVLGWAFDYPKTMIKDWSYTPTDLVGFTCGTSGDGAGELLEGHYQSLGQVPAGCPALAVNQGEATATVDVPAGGSYEVRTRVRASDAAHDTFFLQVDDACPVAVGDGESVPGAWGWVGLSGGAPVRFTLPAGPHTVRLIGGDFGLDVDRVEFVQADDSTTSTSESTTTSSSTTSSSSTTTSSSTTSSSTTTSTTTTTTTTLPPVSRTFAPVADATVDARRPTKNLGTDKALWADGGSTDLNSYLRFNVTGLTGPVRRALLRVYANSASNNGPAVYATSSTWSETGITWRNRPVAAGGPLQDKGRIAARTWVEYDVTAAVTGNGLESFIFDTTATDGIDFFSRERSANRPQLVISQ